MLLMELLTSGYLAMPLFGRSAATDFANWAKRRYPGGANVTNVKPSKPGTNRYPSFNEVAEIVARQVANYEGYRNIAYKPVPADPWTIGYGSTTHPDGRPVKAGETIDQKTAWGYLTNRVKSDMNFVKKSVRVPMNPNQLAALASFAYNVGHGNFQSSTLLRKLNAGDYAGAAAQFGVWTRDGSGQRLAGLVKRREQEKLLFNKKFP